MVFRHLSFPVTPSAITRKVPADLAGTFPLPLFQVLVRAVTRTGTNRPRCYGRRKQNPTPPTELRPG